MTSCVAALRFFAPNWEDSDIKIASAGGEGGIGGSHYCCDDEFNSLPKALQCNAIDIIGMHGYNGKASDWASLHHRRCRGCDACEEWGVSVDYQDGFDAQVKVFNDAGIPWVSATPRR